MSKVILNLAQTIDGYISRIDGRVDFLPEFDGDMGTSFQSFLNQVDVIVMGRTTYEEYKSYGYEMYGDVNIVVWTTKPHEPIDNITFCTESITSIVSKYNQKTIWCFGGTKVIDAFMKEDLIDEFHITTVPYLLGDGKPLFLKGFTELPLDIINVEQGKKYTTVKYRRKK